MRTRDRLAWTPLSALLIAAATACGPAPGEPEATSGEDEISTRTPAYVTLRRDVRRCIAPLCGGYWIKDVNRSRAEVYVSALDFSEANLDDATIAKVHEAAELVIFGRLGPRESQFNTRPLVVLEAYRGLPGVTARTTDGFYSVTTNDPPIQCFAAPCNNDLARRLNSRAAQQSFTGVEVAPVLRGFVDAAWLVGRVERHGALVSAHFEDGQQFPAGRERLLVTSQIYIRLPDTTGPCPAMPIARCPEGQVNVFGRNADRCIIPAGCVEPGFCTEAFPVCDEGYTLASWAAAPNGCEAYACDPSFVTEEAPIGRCALVRCAPGYHCVEDGPDACIPDLTCASVLCAPDTHCVEQDGGPVCVADEWVSEATALDSGNPYRNDQLRSWIFTSDLPNTTSVRLHFARFDLEDGYDFVIVQDANGNELARYTGALGEFTSDVFTGASVRIVFVSDYSITRTGFAIDHIDARAN